MALTFDQFMAGIAQQESGGSYSAINGSTGALGKYQILPSNVPYWSEKYLGQRWSAQQFLNDPHKQEALARAVLHDYYDRYGVRGAAAAWFSGNPALANDYVNRGGGAASVGAYVDSVIAHATGQPAYVNTSTDPTGVWTHGDLKVTTEDKRQKPKTALPKAAESSDMGAFASPGAGSVKAPGSDAVSSATGAEAVGAAPSAVVQGPGAPTDAPPGLGQAGQVSAAPGDRTAALNAVAKYLGVPYVFGGGGSGGPTKSSLAHGNFNQVGFDCSGLVQYLLAQAGVSAPRLSYDQLRMGTPTALRDLQPGDLVGFGDGGHIAFYLGNNKIVEAPKTGLDVRIRSLGTNENAFGVSLANLY